MICVNLSLAVLARGSQMTSVALRPPKSGAAIELDQQESERRPRLIETCLNSENRRSVSWQQRRKCPSLGLNGTRGLADV